jgi:copper chaperone CopZ
MRLRVVIEGMLSVHAKRAVFTALAGIEGVRHADVEVGSAVVDADPGVGEDLVRTVIEELGLRVTSITKELPVM